MITQTLPDPMRPILVDALALSALESEVRDRYTTAGTESGGLLVGPPGSRTVLDFIPSGAGAQRAHAHYRTDPEYLQRALDACFARHGGDVLGYAHSHPAGIPEPSRADLVEAARMLADPDYRVSDEVLLPIAQVYGDAVQIRWFVYLREGIAVEVDAIVVPHWEAVADLGRQLESDGFTVDQRNLGEPGLVLVASRGRERFALVLAPEYPHAPPQVFRMEGDDPVEEVDSPWSARPLVSAPALASDQAGAASKRMPSSAAAGPFFAEFGSRSAGLVDPVGLRQTRVALIGCGSVGSAMATQLVRAGVGGLTLFDPDTVSIANLARSEYELADVGRPKVEALAGRLLRIHPHLELYPRAEDFLTLDDAALAELAVLHEVVVVAVDTPNAIRAANHAFHTERPVVYPGVYEMGRGGEVLFTRPDLPCLECFLRETRFGSDPAPVHRRVDYGSADGRLQAEPALVAQIGHIVSVATMVTLALLCRDPSQSTEMSRLLDPGFSAIFLSNQAGWIFDHPFQGVWARVDRDPACPCHRHALE